MLNWGSDDPIAAPAEEVGGGGGEAGTLSWPLYSEVVLVVLTGLPAHGGGNCGGIHRRRILGSWGRSELRKEKA